MDKIKNPYILYILLLVFWIIVTLSVLLDWIDVSPGIYNGFSIGVAVLFFVIRTLLHDNSGKKSPLKATDILGTILFAFGLVILVGIINSWINVPVVLYYLVLIIIITAVIILIRDLWPGPVGNFLKFGAVAILVFAASSYDTYKNDPSGPMCDHISDAKGPLVVKEGSTVTLRAGGTYEYSSILIKKGGTLQFVGDNPEWTVLRARHNFWLEGKIIANGFNLKSKTITKTIHKDSLKNYKSDSIIIVSTKPKIDDNYLLLKYESLKLLEEDTIYYYDTISYRTSADYKEVTDLTISGDITKASISPLNIRHTYSGYSKGGKGGAGGRNSECHPYSKLLLSSYDGHQGKTKQGGRGGTGMNLQQIQMCNKASLTQIGDCYLCKNRESKPSTVNCLDCTDKDKEDNECKKRHNTISSGDGGDGGGVGKSGGLLYIEVCGNFISEEGSIDVSGSKGLSGAAGDSNKYTGGGGGGGGPGGNGGSVYFNVRGHLDLPDVNIDGGDGGDGGPGGKPHPLDGLKGYEGQPGKKGGKGKRGIINICQNKECLPST